MALERYTPYALALLRIVAGLVFMEHGTQKLLGFPAGDHANATMFTLFWYGGIIEMVGGFLIAIGLFTRPAAFLCSGQMAVAYWMFHAPHSPFPAQNGGDAAVLFCFVFLLLVFTGAGAFSVDRTTSRSSRSERSLRG